MVRRKTIWLINQYAMPPHLESRLRTIKFAHYLRESGYEVIIFSSSIMHNMNKNLITDNSSYILKQYDDLKFVFINTISYSKNGIKRFLGLIQFPIKLFLISRKFKKPNVIIQTATVPFGNILYYCAKMLKAQYNVEILDLWPQTFVDLGMISPKNPLLKLAYMSEKWLYKKADNIVFSMEGGKDYIIDKKWDIDNGGPIDLKKVFYINNGVDLKDFEFNKSNYILEDDDLDNNDIIKVIYLGSIRLANNVIELIKAAEIIQDKNNIKFLIYGDGDDRERLINYCKSKNINNVIFKQKWIEPKYVPYVLSNSTINILNYKSGDFGKYGGSQSKLFQYMASGKPICCNLDMMYCPIKANNIGIAKNFSNEKEYADAILTLINLDYKEYDSMCERAKEAAKMYDYPELTRKMISVFEDK